VRAEDVIGDGSVLGVQTCALPISAVPEVPRRHRERHLLVLAVTRREDEQVSFAVPAGNFGNVCAGHVARMMGLPIRRLIVATNENDVLDEFFRIGRYRARSAVSVVPTSSPSMDISKASNFERFVCDLVGRDAGLVTSLSR